jgi:4-nitrophenyl phosphatase
MRKLADIKGLIIDMDGVLWRGRTFLEGVPEFFSFLRTNSMPFLLVTNNSTATPMSVVDRMDCAGVQIDPAEVLTSSLATAAHLQQQFPSGTTIYAIGEDALKGALSAVGFRLHDSADGVQAVVMGFDREISWTKMTEASIAIQSGALFVATNPDLSFPIERGQAPGAGAFIKAVQLTTGVEPLIIGKPEPRLFNLARERLGLSTEQILALGDRLETDVLGAQHAGIAACLLLTGVTTSDQAEASTIKPNWIFDDLPSLTLELARIHE